MTGSHLGEQWGRTSGAEGKNSCFHGPEMIRTDSELVLLRVVARTHAVFTNVFP